jgi:large subunit ribosomal protein L13
MATSKMIKQTLSLRKEDVDKKWFLINAEGVVLGRLASKVSMILRGKHKPSFTPHADCGDHIIIINAEKVKFTGKKLDDKIYYWHTGHPGGIKSRTARQIIEGKFPDRVIRMAVKRMIPKGPLGSVQLSNMKVYAGSNHPHEAQSPELLNISEML